MVTVRKRTITMLIAALMVAVVAVGATLAFLANRTNTAVNHFSMASPDDVSGVIKEEGWDDDKDKTAKPGAEFKKKITVENTSKDDAEIWVAVKMSITKGPVEADNVTTALAAGDLEKITAIMTPVFNDKTNPWFNEADWTRHEPGAAIKEHEIFFYKTKLGKGSTSQLFDKVQILESATSEQIKAVNELEGGGFNLVMSGAVLQGVDGQDTLTDELKAELIGLLDYKGK